MVDLELLQNVIPMLISDKNISMLSQGCIAIFTNYTRQYKPTPSMKYTYNMPKNIVLTAMTMKIIIFWYVTPYIIVGSY